MEAVTAAEAVRMDNREAAADTRAWEDRPLWQTRLPQARQPQRWPAGASSWCPHESNFNAAPWRFKPFGI